MREILQPEMNVGTAGHVDHGKSTLVQALTGVWPERHSEELRRGITIKLGYANADLRKCPSCDEPKCYTTSKKCPIDGSETILLRKISLVDCPGHDTLMATMLAGSTLMDAALFIIASNEPVPQPQTREHLMALKIMGVKQIIVVQTKIELVSEEEAIRNYEQILRFLEANLDEIPPIIPVSALHGVNIDFLIREMVRRFAPPQRDPTKTPKMYVARSFDVNRPGTRPEKLVGGVLGGTIIQGRFRLGDEIEIRPGAYRGGKFIPLTTKIVSLKSEDTPLEEAYPGGLIGVGTLLDPALTKADNMVGSVVGLPNELPPVWSELDIEAKFFDKIVGMKEEIPVTKPKSGDFIQLNVGTATVPAVLKEMSHDLMRLLVRIPAVAELDQRVAISARIGNRWRLIGFGHVKGGVEYRY
ncbi:translation initiation factor IF-2 subunit gamma [Candidatus Korarchaeum cryptofilum]|jgi:translation initiation factor 2 subunit 3|uniref:protein-synthesizing GTPase n=1 Tax=Candidatus Korarchaeum cryptofilum TaxID=498846 RepID=A0A3R9QZY3_9CREN|nr:translation initiation factor IF-2 subunit gamma [Candidatus Korarchaeum cryptofilum]RSN70568.1 translation initiation factor IF-2 subunit gamma [Candidatus Korarchaeum cryptofilum]